MSSSVDAVPRSLVFGLDDGPGLRRTGHKRFRYRDDVTGEPVEDPATMARIRALAVPPAWVDVWISADPCCHLQATGRDARGRKQYRYHPDFRAHREDAKFDQLVPFAAQLPQLRRRVAEDLGRRGLPFERVTALIVALLDETFIRIGNEEYVRANRSFGLTTLRDRHVQMQGTTLHLRFAGKGAKVHAVDVGDRRLARLILRCQDLPGQVLFQYVEEDQTRAVRSSDVNEYLREATGLDVTAKTFRTWGASTLAASGLAAAPCSPGAAERQHLANEVLRGVAEVLNNTLAVCRRSYVHPRLLADFQDGSFADRWRASSGRGSSELSVDERRLAHYLAAGTR
ncbi:MAG TPA: hypothetical protein VGH94_03770 [Acidimicrobiales bacterium]|jgi:DNA topoisomerase-1